MDRNKNYYTILGLTKSANRIDIKKKYYKLSFECHPDRNKDVDVELFNNITEAYKILSDDSLKDEYDLKSKWGKNYNEYFEFFELDFNYTPGEGKDKLKDFKKNEINNIQIEVDDQFDGSLEYERWVKCKTCDGTGKDLSSKIIIRDTEGNIKKVFDSDDGCDFCEGTGKNHKDEYCEFCNGKGKIGLNKCNTCKGEKRILGKQKISGIKLDGSKKLDTMGHYSKGGKVGYLLIVKK